MSDLELQALVNGMSAQWQRQRSATQMTLGKLIAALEAIPADVDVAGLGRPHSYRGYYSDLAFEPTEGTVKAADLLAQCKAAMGKVFEGYKGGDFVMGEITPVWVADYGSSGLRLMAVHPDGNIETAPDDSI